MKPIILTLSALFFLCYSHAQNPRDIAQKASNAIEVEAMEMAATLKIHDNRGNVRERKIAVATKKFDDTYKTLIRFLEPADVRGTGMLIYDYDDNDDDMWVFMPSLRKSRRIVSSEKAKSFMGSEFSNADMSSPNLDDFNYKLEGTEIIDGRECWVIESVSKTDEIADENGFSKQISYIGKDNYLTYKVEYYDFFNELLKVMTISDYKKQSNGSFFAFNMQMENVQNNRKSVYIVNKFQLGSKLSENNFTITALEQF